MITQTSSNVLRQFSHAWQLDTGHLQDIFGRSRAQIYRDLREPKEALVNHAHQLQKLFTLANVQPGDIDTIYELCISE